MLEVLVDEKLIGLIDRIRELKGRYRSGSAILLGYDKDNQNIVHVKIFSDKETLEKKFTPEERAKLDGRVVAHVFGYRVYECLVDIADDAPERGKWVIEGFGKTEAEPFVRQPFETYEAMIAGKEEAFAKINEWAVIHKAGTKSYTFVDLNHKS